MERYWTNDDLKCSVHGAVLNLLRGALRVLFDPNAAEYLVSGRRTKLFVLVTSNVVAGA